MIVFYPMSKEIENFKKGLLRIVDKAKEDGHITEEEQKIIEQIEIDKQKYLDYLEEARSDGVVSKEEAEKLRTLRKKLLENVETAAMNDGQIDDDEKRLIVLLYNVVTNMKKY